MDKLRMLVGTSLIGALVAVSCTAGQAPPATEGRTGEATASAPPATLAATGATAVPAARPAPTTTPAARPAATAASSAPAAVLPQAGPQGGAFILIRSAEVTPDSKVNFFGQGFGANERVVVEVADPRGQTLGRLDSVLADREGRINEVSLALPAGLQPGELLIKVRGDRSGKSAQAGFRLKWLPPKVALDTYTAKPDHAFGFTATGFARNEKVEVRLGGLGGAPLATFTADDRGAVAGSGVTIPLIQAGDYPLYFVGQQSKLPVSVGFNVQGFTPWVVLDDYVPLPYQRLGFTARDFAPREPVLVYLDKREGDPLAVFAANDRGDVDVKQAFELPAIKGDHTLILVGQAVGKEATGRFTVGPFAPSLELTAYSVRPGTPIAFVGKGWARGERLRAAIAKSDGKDRRDLGTFESDRTGSFTAAGSFPMPLGIGPGNVPLIVVGETSGAEATVWLEVQDLKPSAELSRYDGPSGTIVSFTARAFMGGEMVSVHLREKSGPVVAQKAADATGTFDQVGSYTVEGAAGADATPFVFVGETSGASATTHFKVTP